MGVHISSVRVVSSNREKEHRMAIERAAGVLATPAPLWLVDVLSDFSFEVASQHSIDEITRTRKETFVSVSSAQEMAAGLVDFLRGPGGPGFIAAHASEVSEEFQQQLIGSLEKFLAGSRTARASMLDETGRIRAGRGKAVLPGMMSARYTCAAIVSEAAAFVEEYRFAPTSKVNLYRAATHLWTSWIRLNGWGNSRLPSWKSYFEATADDRLAGLRREVRRHLSIRRAHELRRK